MQWKYLFADTWKYLYLKLKYQMEMEKKISRNIFS